MRIVNEYDVILNKNQTPLLKVKDSVELSNTIFDDPNKVWRLCRDVLEIHKKAEEYMYCLCLNSAGELIGIFEVSHGNVNTSFVDPRSIFQRALLVGAVSIILIHNHPSGRTTPSRDDIDVTKRVKEAGILLNIRLVDHIIIAKNDYRSIVSLA